MQQNTPKKIGTVQIDVDGIWVIFQHFGFDYEESSDILYESSLPRFLELFKAHDIKATFFVVGKDLYCPSKVNLLKRAAQEGHEIANHSMTHAEGFSYLSLERKKQEIIEAEKIIHDKLGILTKGFRTPSNDVDSEVLGILEDRGYIYDSSLLPTYFGPLLKRLKFVSVKIPGKNHYLGRFSYGFSPLIPYNPCMEAIWKRGKMRLLEVPITTMPYLRFPFHTSFAFAAYQLGFGYGLFKLGYSLLKTTSLPLNFVFHTNELSNSIYIEKIKRQLGLNLPVETKQEICNNVLSAIKKDFRTVTSLEYAGLFSQN